MYRLICGVVLLAIFPSLGHSGVYYYSGNNQNIVFSGDTQPDSWSPIASPDAGSGAITLQSTWSSPTLTWSDVSSNYAFFTTDSGGKLLTETAADTLTASSSTLVAVSSQTLGMNTSDRAVDYDPTSSTNNFFGWKVQNSSSQDVYIGWARFVYDPVAPGGNSASQFKIVDWAYNVVTGGVTSIAFGDTDTSGSTRSSSPSVPEPTGLAVMGIAIGGLMFRRRR